jgi:PucR-like helix-turn-helix protein/diguanylate cyclase with GGDEF domain
MHAEGMGQECQEFVDEVCELLGIPATLEGRDFGLIAYGAHDGVDEGAVDPVRTRSILGRGSTAAVRAWFESFGIARARGPVRIPPEPAAGVLTGRVCLPVRHGGVVYGYIWLLDGGALALDDPRLATAAARAERIGALLAAEARAGDRLAALLRAALAAPPGTPGTPGTPGPADELAAALGASARGPLTIVAVAPWPGSLAAPAGVPGAIALCEMATGGDAVLAVLTRPGSARAVAERLRDAGGGDGGGAAAGIGAERQGVEGLAAAWREALAAARAAGAQARFAGVAEWAGIGPYRLLTALPAGDPDPAAAPLLLPEHRELARTAEAFLDHAGRAAVAAAALGIHRQTLYYRLAGIERLTGLDLGKGEDRLLLHMALKAARLQAHRPGS